MSIARSALERDSTLLNAVFELSIDGSRVRATAALRRARRSAEK